MEANLRPYSIFLVKKGGGGDRILFRYPYNVSSRRRTLLPSGAPGGNSGLPAHLNAGTAATHCDALNLLNVDSLPTFHSRVLSNLFAVHPKLCGEKFELKINDVRFVGHPVSLEVRKNEERFLVRRPVSPMTMFNVIFALKASAAYSVVECFYDLAQLIASAIKYEERRCGFITFESKTMSDAQDEMTLMPEDSQTSPFSLVLERSALAQDLKKIYDDMCHSGIVYVRINRYIEVSFCMPQKVFRRIQPQLSVQPEAIFKCLEALRPYHGMLLLYEERELLDQFPLDSSPSLKKLIREASPMKSFRTLASDADLSLRQVFHLCGHLLYWGKAIVIYPICESNVYVLSPKISDPLSRTVRERFADKFPGESLIEMLSIFSLPTSMSQRSQPTYHNSQLQLLTRVVVWFLQQHLLVQMHTYVTLALNKEVKFHMEDPLEKRFKQPSALNERLNGFLQDPHPTLPQSRRSKTPSSASSPSSPSADLNHVSRGGGDHLLRHFSAIEKTTLLQKVSATSTVEDLKLFVRLAPYFNGKYHLEEIMYHENLRRAQLLQIIDKFRSVLVRHEHEDPAVTMYFD